MEYDYGSGTSKMYKVQNHKPQIQQKTQVLKMLMFHTEKCTRPFW